MAIWRPPQAIRAKVIGLAWQGSRLLAVEVLTDDGRVKGVRPPGGSILFGESREQALRREFREELDSAVMVCGDWQAFESIYSHEGTLGHEIIFAVEVTLVREELYHQAEIVFCEDDGTVCRARWVDPVKLEECGVALYPTGLAASLARSRRGG